MWIDHHGFALVLAPGGRVFPLHRAQPAVDEMKDHDCWAELHAMAEPELRRMLFASDWGRTGSEAARMYHVVLPAGSQEADG